MRIPYLLTEAAPVASKINVISTELERRLSALMGKKSPYVLKDVTLSGNGFGEPEWFMSEPMIEALLGDRFYFSDAPENRFFSTGTIYRHQPFLDAEADVEENTDDPNYLNSAKKIVRIKTVAAAHYTASGLGQATGRFFLSSLQLHGQMRPITADPDGPKAKFYFRELFSELNPDPDEDPIFIYGGVQKFRRYAVADLIFEKYNAGAFTFQEEWDRYNFIRVHNLRADGLTVTFPGGHEMALGPWQCGCVRRVKNGASWTYYAGTYFFPIIGGVDARVWNVDGCAIQSLKANNVLNVSVLIDWINLMREPLQLATDTDEYFNATPWIGHTFGLPAGSEEVPQESGLLADRLFHGGKVKIITDRTASVPTVTDVTVQSFSTLAADFAASGVAVEQDANWNVRLRKPGADILPVSTNLLNWIAPGTTADVALGLQALDTGVYLAGGNHGGQPGFVTFLTAHPEFPVNTKVGNVEETYNFGYLPDEGWFGNASMRELQSFNYLNDVREPGAMTPTEYIWSDTTKVWAATVPDLVNLKLTGVPSFHASNQVTTQCSFEGKKLIYTPFGLTFLYRKEIHPTATGLIPGQGQSPAIPITSRSMVDPRQVVLENGRLVIKRSVFWRGFCFPDPNSKNLGLSAHLPQVYGVATPKGFWHPGFGFTIYEWAAPEFVNDVEAIPSALGFDYDEETSDASDWQQVGITSKETTEIKFHHSLGPAIKPQLLNIFPSPDWGYGGVSHMTLPVNVPPDNTLEVLKHVGISEYYKTYRTALLARRQRLPTDGFYFLRPALDALNLNGLAMRVNQITGGRPFTSDLHFFEVPDWAGPGPKWRRFKPNKLGMFGQTTRPADSYRSIAPGSWEEAFCVANGIPIRGEDDLPDSWHEMKTRERHEIRFFRVLRTTVGALHSGAPPFGIESFFHATIERAIEPPEIFEQPGLMVWPSLGSELFKGVTNFSLNDYRWVRALEVKSWAEANGFAFSHESLGVPLKLKVFEVTARTEPSFRYRPQILNGFVVRNTAATVPGTVELFYSRLGRANSYVGFNGVWPAFCETNGTPEFLTEPLTPIGPTSTSPLRVGVQNQLCNLYMGFQDFGAYQPGIDGAPAGPIVATQQHLILRLDVDPELLRTEWADRRSFRHPSHFDPYHYLAFRRLRSTEIEASTQVLKVPVPWHSSPLDSPTAEETTWQEALAASGGSTRVKRRWRVNESAPIVDNFPSGMTWNIITPAGEEPPEDGVYDPSLCWDVYIRPGQMDLRNLP